jgi:hypothetical protein
MKKYLLILAIIFFIPVINFAQVVTLTSSPVAAADIAQGSTNNIVYIVKMDVASLPVTINSMQFTLTGTHDDNDLVVLHVYFNPTAPTLSGATQKAVNVSANFAAPHAYNAIFNLGSQGLAAGSSGYFIVLADVAAAATSGNTVKINGLTNPVSFGYSTSPTITNNQTDIAGTQTILAAGVTLTTSPVAAANITQGSNSNVLYIAKMDVAAQAVTVNSMQFTLTGTHDDNDLLLLHVYFNPTAPTLSGATVKAVKVSANFAAPHAYNALFNTGNQALVAGSSGYFIVLADVAAAATSGNTVKINGLTNPVSFGYSTSPTITNNQTDIAGTQTIVGALPLTLISFTGNTINTNEVQLQWQTAQEINTKDFEIEWSIDGSRFEKISMQSAAGNSSQTLHYSYTHNQPVTGTNYYRLKMVDIDGRFTYSPVIVISNNAELFSVKIFPNPVADILQLHIHAEKKETILFNLFNTEGKKIDSKKMNLQKGSNYLNWNMQTLAKGNYFLAADAANIETIKIIKK